ncbi:hypothetical protein CASFOL_036348 [Castilleja foliolosa]|uniref:FLZ-type domain-containing protein n=1 Tax=Castilleja foliolosa TaxID=1961234 RepID=A0ABD3BWH2_9LAMI
MMQLGKRARPPMKRTTSMTEFTLDLNNGAYQPSDPHHPFNGLDQPPLAAPRLNRRNSDLGPTANFLRVCSLCKRRLTPGRDIYMYRGDSAFCSLECRQRKMAEDEKKEKYSSAPNMGAAKAAVGN